MTLSPVLRAVHVRRSPQDCFDLFTTRVGAWWPLGTHGLFHAGSAGVAFVDGALVERSLDGRTAVWGRVTVWEPGRRLALTWHPGGDGSTPTSVVVDFLPVEDGTRVEVTHSGWEVLGDGAAAGRRGYAGPNAWGWVLEHFADTAERRLDAAAGLPGTHLPDTAALTAAAGAFLAQAGAGGFADPPDGGWTAAEVVAHVALTSAALAAVDRELLEGREVVFDNASVENRECLRALADAHAGDLAALVAVAARAAEEHVLLVERLTPEQLATKVPAKVVDGGRVVLDEPVPWGVLAVTVQAGRHLPAHTAQLAALLGG
jgi:uncharacterized protein YndB with AHSA1/START domain